MKKIILLLICLVGKDALASACGLRDVDPPALQVDSETIQTPAEKQSPFAMVKNRAAAQITTVDGEKVLPQDDLRLSEGMTIRATAGDVEIIIPSTNQRVRLAEGSDLKILSQNKSADKRICSLSFEIKKGSVNISSDHEEQKQNCLVATAAKQFELATPYALITPTGTEYTTDLDSAVAELNREKPSHSESIDVRKGSIQIRLRKEKSVQTTKSTKQQIAKSDYDSDDKPVTVKSGAKAKIKKGKKDRIADIEIIDPEK